jgi:hypothetical protein
MTTETEYLLDTQAIRSLPRAALDAAEKSGVRLRLSPISVWELLCHVDESETNGEGWRKAKGHLLRARRCLLLDDPFAEHAVFVTATKPAAANPTRFDDRVVIPQMLAHLDSSNSLEDFYSREVTYRSGEKGQVKGCAERVRELLREEEAAHARRCQDRRKLIIEKLGGVEAITNISDADYLLVTGGVSTSLADHYRENGIDDELLLARIFCSTFLHMAYIFERTRLYLQNADHDGTMHVDPNDTEDGMVCLHLNVTVPRVLVTDDKATQKALTSALNRLDGIIRNKGDDLPVLTRVLSCDEFRAECDV